MAYILIPPSICFSLSFRFTRMSYRERGHVSWFALDHHSLCVLFQHYSALFTAPHFTLETVLVYIVMGCERIYAFGALEMSKKST